MVILQMTSATDFSTREHTAWGLGVTPSCTCHLFHLGFSVYCYLCLLYPRDRHHHLG